MVKNNHGFTNKQNIFQTITLFSEYFNFLFVLMVSGFNDHPLFKRDERKYGEKLMTLKTPRPPNEGSDFSPAFITSLWGLKCCNWFGGKCALLNYKYTTEKITIINYIDVFLFCIKLHNI